MSRIVVPHAPHHLCVRGNNRRILYASRDECERYLFFAATAKAKTPVELHAATLMTNHAHLVVTPSHVDALEDFMHRLNQRFASYHNELRGGSGKVFEQEFFSKPIVDEQQLAMTLAYVDLNPVRAGVSPRSWRSRWTSYWNHVNGKRPILGRALWTPHPWYLELGSSPETRAVRYATWAKDCLVSGEMPEHVGPLEEAEARFAQSMAPALRRPDGSSAR